MKLSIRSRRVKALAVTGALVASALPFAAASSAGAAPAPKEPYCAGSFVGDIANPDDNLPGGIIPLTTGYTATGRVTSGQDKLINTVNNSDDKDQPSKGVRFSANLKTSSTPAYNQIIGGPGGPQVPDSNGYLKASWKNGKTIAPHPSGSPGIPSGVEYKLPTLEIGEQTKLIPAPSNKLVIAKGTLNYVPTSASSVGVLPPAAIIQTLGTVTGSVVPNADIVAGSMVLSYKSTYFPTRQALFAIYPDAAAPGLAANAAFIATADGALAALNPLYVPVGPVFDPDDYCTTVGLIYVACIYAPTLLPPTVAGLCALTP
jgi:hypothetical protein